MPRFKKKNPTPKITDTSDLKDMPVSMQWVDEKQPDDADGNPVPPIRVPVLQFELPGGAPLTAKPADPDGLLALLGAELSAALVASSGYEPE